MRTVDATLPAEEVIAYAMKRGFDPSKTQVKPVIMEHRAVRSPYLLKLSGIFEKGQLVATLRRRRDGRYSYSNLVGAMREA